MGDLSGSIYSVTLPTLQITTLYYVAKCLPVHNAWPGLDSGVDTEPTKKPG